MKTRSESERVASYLESAGAEVPQKYASGGRVKPQTTIQINIGREKPQAPDPMALAAMAKPPVVNPQPAPPPMPGPGMAPPGAGPVPGMKTGGAVRKAMGGLASAAGVKPRSKPVASGPAPSRAERMDAAVAGSRARRASGGRVTKIPMDAGSMSGDGRQNKAISQAKASGQKQPVKGTFRTAK